ncbi:unnamed protein product, partial [Staurois parvus]
MSCQSTPALVNKPQCVSSTMSSLRLLLAQENMQCIGVLF